MNYNKKTKTELIAELEELKKRLNLGGQSEAASQQAACLFETVVSSSPDLIWTADRDFNILFINRTANGFVGYMPEELIGESLGLLFKTQSYQTLRDNARTLVSKPEAPEQNIQLSAELEISDKGGQSIWTENSIRPVFGAGGAFEHFVGTTRNISLRKSLENELNELNTRLESSYSSKPKQEKALPAGELNNSDNRFRDFMNMLPECVFETDKNGLIIYINKRGLEMFGYTQEDYDRGVHATDLIAPEYRKDALQYREQAMSGLPVRFAEFLGLRRDGTRFPLLINSLCHTSQGIPSGTRGIALDISERVKSETALKESEAKLRSIIEATGTIMLLIDEDNDLKFANHELERQTGYSFEESKGQAWLQMIHEDDLEKLQEYSRLRKIDAKMAPKGYEIRIRDKQDTIRYYYISLSKDFTSNLKVASLLDITERKRTENALVESEKRFKTAIDSLPYMFAILDSASRYRFVNRYALQLMGRRLHDLVGLTDEDVFMEDNAKKICALRNEAFSTRKSISADISLRTDYSYYDYKLTYIPILDELGNLNQVLVSGMEITESKRAFEAARENFELLKQTFFNLPIPAYSLNANDEIRFASRAFCELVGVHETEVFGRKISEIYGTRLHSIPRNEIKLNLKENGSATSQLESKSDANNETRTLTLKASALLSASGKYDGSVEVLAGSAAPAPDYSRIESFEAIFDNAPLGIMYVDFSQAIEFIRHLQDNGIENLEKYFSTNQYELEKFSGRIDVLHSNEASMQIFGKHLRKAVRKISLAKMHLYNRQAMISTALALAAGQLEFECEGNFLQANGLAEPHVIRWKRLPEDPNKGIICAFVTEHQLLGRPTSRDDNFFDTSFADIIPFPVFAIDENARFAFTNNAFCDFYGVAKEDINGKHCSEYPGPLCQQDDIQSLHEIIFSLQSPQRIERSFVGPNGETVYWESIKIPFFHRNKGYVLFIGSDISAFKQRETALRAANSYNRSLFETAIDPIFVVDIHSQITDVNTSAELVTGLSRDKLIGTDLQKYFTEPERAESYMQSVFHNGMLTDFELNLLHINGSACSMVCNASLFTNDAGKVLGLMATARDMTERKRFISALRESENRLRDLNSTKDKFFSIIAHDLKNPLASFASITEMLLKSFDVLRNDEKKEMIQNVNFSAKKLTELLENLLTWSRSQTGRIQFTPDFINLKYVSDNTISFLKINSDKKNITLRNDIADSVEVYADTNMVSTVIRNIVSNAIKFTPEGGQICISAELAERIVTVTIEDNGVGIEPEGIQKIFRIDESFSTPGTSNETGTGLGLILCKEFIEKHKGTIWVESTKGVGSRFRFTLPKYVL